MPSRFNNPNEIRPEPRGDAVSRDVPTRLVIVGELLWHAKQVIGCILAFTPWRLP